MSRLGGVVQGGDGTAVTPAESTDRPSLSERDSKKGRAGGGQRRELKKGGRGSVGVSPSSVLLQRRASLPQDNLGRRHSGKGAGWGPGPHCQGQIVSFMRRDLLLRDLPLRFPQLFFLSFCSPSVPTIYYLLHPN